MTSTSSYCASCERHHDMYEWADLGLLCPRCDEHTGNSSQGHYWGLCNALLKRGATWKQAIRQHHFCCPDKCELEESHHA